MGPGSIIADRFRIEKFAGRGGMASVYRGIDLAHERPVAIKLVEPEHTANREQRFTREARILALLKHDTIVDYIAHGCQDDQLYLVMEWLDGRELRQRIKERPLDRSEALRLGLQIADALDAAHALGVIHRDIKPSNIILVDGDVARIKLIDFGIAHLDTATVITQSGMLVGTPGYLAPEQAGGQGTIDGRTDLYALGAVLFYSLSGKAPFTGDHVMAILAKMHFAEVPRLAAACPDVASDLDELVARLMAKDPDERPASAAEVVAQFTTMGRVTRAHQARVRSDSAISTNEQRYVSVMLVGHPPAPPEQPATPRPSLQRSPPRPVAGFEATWDELAERARDFGGALAKMADDTIAAVFSDESDPDQSAGNAARLALELRDRLPGAPIVIATGRGLVARSLPVGEVIDRAVAHLMEGPTAIIPELGEDADTDADADADTLPILLDQLTARLIERRFHIEWNANRPGDSVPDRPVLRGVARGPRSDHTLLGKATRCVGRRREFAALGGILDECTEDSVSRAVLVVGPAGSGKSRLGQEFIERLKTRTRAIRIMSAHSDSMHAGASLAMAGQVIRNAMGIDPADSGSIVERKILQRVAALWRASDLPDPDSAPEAARDLDVDRDRVAVFLGEIAGARVPSERHLQLREARNDPRLMADQTLLAWEDWLAAESARQPVVLLLDDLQWSDQPTLRFVSAAVRTLEDRPIMVLAMARPEIDETFPDLWSGMELDRMILRPLTRNACATIAQRVLPDSLPEAALARLIERSAGNPLHLEELLRSAAEGVNDDVPDSVLALVEARLRAQPSSDRRVLRAASVFGRQFWLGGLEALLGDPPGVIEACVERLTRRELLERRRLTRFTEQREYAFTHDVVHEAAYATLPTHESPSAHRRAGAWLESMGEHEAPIIAEHYHRGQVPDLALPWLKRAAEQALAASNLDAAITNAERAVACGARDRTLGALRLVQAEAYNWKNDHRRAGDAARRARTLLPCGSVQWAHAMHQQMWADSYVCTTEALEAGARTLLESVPGRLDDIHIAALAMGAYHLLQRGLEDLAVSLRTVIRDRMPADQAGPLAHAAVAELDSILAQLRGESATSLQCMERATDHWLTLGHERNAGLSLLNIGVICGYLGQYPRGLDAMARGFEIVRRLDLDYYIDHFTNEYALLLARSGEVQRALQSIGEGDELSATPGSMLELLVRVHRAHIQMLASRPEAALGELDVLDLVTTEQAYPTHAAYARAVQTDVLLSCGRTDEALRAAEAGIRLVHALGTIDEGDAYVRLMYAEALHAAGQNDRAARAIREAYDRLMARADDIEDAQWRDDFLHAVVENRRTLERARQWNAIE